MAPLSIAVIGCGPSGMSFCHAVESMQAESDATQQISVTCFERSTRPGGIWKAANSSSKKEAMNMYDALWTNGPSHCIEFEDYTFDEHFGRPVTVYLSRQEVLGYLIGRVTKNCPDFFEKYVEFGKEVVEVEYDDAMHQFHVTVQAAGETEVRKFDKVIWACGDNGRPYIPRSLNKIFKNFQGRFIHSADTSNLEQDVKGKSVLLIGGGYSAEDLALQAIKLGVEKVYICSRDAQACGIATKAWPENKVQVLTEQAPVAVQGRVIKFCKTEWSWDDGNDILEDEMTTELCDIDTVICCTGYNLNFEMLAEDLYPNLSKDFRLEVPKDWTMPEHAMTKHVGDVKPCRVYYYKDLTHPELYKGILISNPSMMFVWTYDADFPLLAAEVSAWLLAAYCTGLTELPSRGEMQRQNREQALCELTHPYIRFYMDKNFHKTIMNVPGFNFTEESKFRDEWEQWQNDNTLYHMQLLARHMRDGHYPMNIGSYEKLNQDGETMLKIDQLSHLHRVEITPDEIKKHPWKTFRDYENATEFYSLRTGTRAVPLSQPWMTIDGHATLLHDEEKKNNDFS